MRALILTLFLTPCLSLANSISVIHPNPSPSEAKGFSLLQKSLAKENLTWVSELPTEAVFPSADEMKNYIERNNINTGMALVHGKELERWYDLGVVRHLTNTANSNQWRNLLPGFIYKNIQHRGQIVAVPSGLHITNTIWANKKVMDQTGLSFDNSWDNFIAILSKIKASGVTPIIMIDNAEFDALLFESLLLAEVGAETYSAAMIQLDSSALRAVEPAFELVFEKLKVLKPYISRLPEGTDIAKVADAIHSGTAAMTIQGTWLQGEFNLKGLIANQHYYCVQVPGEHQGVIFMLDTFAALSTSEADAQQQQDLFANKVIDKNNQLLMNNYSGALSVIPGTGLDTLNECNAYAVNRVNEASANNRIVGSTAMGMNLPIPIGEEVLEIIHNYMTSTMSPSDTASHLRKRMKYGSFVIN